MGAETLLCVRGTGARLQQELERRLVVRRERCHCRHRPFLCAPRTEARANTRKLHIRWDGAYHTAPAWRLLRSAGGHRPPTPEERRTKAVHTGLI